MSQVIVIGDGPAGLSAALFLAKNGHQVQVLGEDETAMHYAELHNYLGIDEIHGTEFQERARAQVASFGAKLHDVAVRELARDGEGFRVVTDGGQEHRADHVIAAGGKNLRQLVVDAGGEVRDDGGVVVDGEYRTGVDGLYAVGRLARPDRSQAIISAGAGAVAALDILSREAGEDVHDWDTPE